VHVLHDNASDDSIVCTIFSAQNFLQHYLRFPPEMISHAVWLSFRFSLSFRDVEELLAQRGIVVTYETVRQWCLKFGQTYANELRRRRPRCLTLIHMFGMLEREYGEDGRQSC
jgi:transposase-like protein